jgi:hypothetical protein
MSKGEGLKGCAWWFIPAIPATQEVEMRKMAI